MAIDPIDPLQVVSVTTFPELEQIATEYEDDVPERIGSYEIDRVIARGAHGVVFKATDPHGIRVAVKWLKKRRDDDELATFVRLSQTVNGVPPILSSGVMNDRTYFVMPYYPRRSLRFRLRTLAFPQPVDEAIRMARAMTEVLGEFHRHGYTHGDFKPDNVLLEALPTADENSRHSLIRDDERLVLTDFGTTRSVDDDDRFGDGTPGYAAPELLTSVVDHDPRIDIYAASTTLVECVTGVVPTQVRSRDGSAFAPEVLARTGPLAPVLAKSLSYEPHFRPETIAGWFDDLVAAANVSGPARGEKVATKERKPTVDTVALPPVGEVSDPPRYSMVPVAKRVAQSLLSFMTLVVLVVVAYWGLTRLTPPASFVAQADDSGQGQAATPDAETVPSTIAGVSDFEGGVSVPPLLESLPDPLWGTSRTRLSAVQYDGDGSAPSDGARFHRIDNASSPVMSPNERWLLAQRDGRWTVIDRSNGEFQVLSFGRASQPTWHPSEPETILYLADDRLALLSKSVDEATVVVADLHERVVAELPGAVKFDGSSRPSQSDDGLRFAWAVLNDNAEPIGFVTYDLGTDAVLGVMEGTPGGDLGRFDSIAIAKSGATVVLAFENGFVIYAKDFSGERRIEQRPYSYELAFNGSYQDVIVVANFDTGTFGTGWILTHNLDTGESQHLLNLFDNANTNVDFSGLATERAGWVLASSYDCKVEGAWSCDRVMAINVDDATVVDLAQTNSCARSIFARPNAVVNRDFTKAWFNTDFGSCGDDATIVELTIDQIGDP